ncbi:MAG: DUF4838 domain-containing protein [Lentisphaeria bacterium]|nr:DUF4838 domain-containing protein [Lentisphaeria bacterium]
MKLLLSLFLTVLLLPALPETVLVKCKDTVLSTETGSSKAFYVSNAQKYRNQKVIFRMNVKRSEGNAPLEASFRCSTNPGNVLRATKRYPIHYEKNGKKVPVEFVLDIPDLDNIAHFNIRVWFRRMGSEKCVWELSDIRFAEYETGTVPERKEPAVSEEGLPAELTAARMEKPLELVKNGAVKFVIVTADEPDHIARYAAEELRDHFQLACGVAPKIIRESEYKSGPAIMVGETAAAKKYGINPALLAPETLVVARLNDMIVLSGGDNPAIPKEMVSGRSFVPVGTLYAAYEFLEKTVGFRWYWPGKHGTYIPKVKNLSVTRLFTISRPQYDTRKTFSSIIRNDPDVTVKECGQWYRRNRFGGSLGDPVANHSFNKWVERFSKTHPEYLALQADGSRKVYGGGHVCMSNPEVFRQTVEDKLQELKRQQFSSFVKVMPGDSSGLYYCKCPDCQKKLRPEMGESGFCSNAVWGFVNKVAGEVAKKAPGKMIVCCAYNEYRRKPEFPLLPNIAVTLCFPPVLRASAGYKRKWKEFLDEWSSTGAKLYVWEYWILSRSHRGTFGAPAIFPRQLKEIYAMDAGRISGRAIELCSKDSDGKKCHGWSDWVYDIQNLYAAGKLMWNPSEDIDAVMEEYYTKFFGPAAGPVRQFHEEMELAWAKKGYSTGEWNYQRVWKELYPPEFVDRMMGLLKEAVKLAGDQEPYAYRTRKLLKGYQPFERNSRRFRGDARKTNPVEIIVPRIAGNPSAADWKKAAVLKDFTDNYNVYKQDSETNMRLLHDGKNLYVKAECRIPEGVAAVKWAPDTIGKRDGMLWNYESIEFHLARGKESSQFILAPDNCLLDLFNTPSSGKKASKWNCGKVKWSTVRKGNYWEGFLTIPLDEIKFSGPGKEGEYRFNAYHNCRYRMPGEPEKWELSCYLPTYGSFKNIERFGILILSK